MLESKVKILKFISNPFFYIQHFWRKLISIIVYPINVFLFKKIAFSSYVSYRSSIRNHINIILGKRISICPFVVLWPISLEIGDNSQINPGTSIYGIVKIGSNVMIAPNCMIVGGSHCFSRVDIPMNFQGSTEKGIVIEDDVWIGANVVITDGVKIKKGCIIAAGAVVTKNTEAYSIYAGIPAVKIKSRK